MKLFAFIMAFTVLSLSIAPCMDDSEVIYNNAHSAITKTGNQHSHSDADDCSPFCSCSCCSSSVFYQAQSVVFLHTPFAQAKKYSAYKNLFYSEISFSIWQPPKIA